MKEKINKLRKILNSKIDQLSVLIWENFKVTNYDYFIIRKDNLDEQINKIKEKIKKWDEL